MLLDGRWKLPAWFWLWNQEKFQFALNPGCHPNGLGVIWMILENVKIRRAKYFCFVNSTAFLHALWLSWRKTVKWQKCSCLSIYYMHINIYSRFTVRTGYFCELAWNGFDYWAVSAFFVCISCDLLQQYFFYNVEKNCWNCTFCNLGIKCVLL